MNVSMPMSMYSRIRAATCSGSPTSAVPAPPRTSPTPAHRFGLISSLSRRPPWRRSIRRWPTESMRAKVACARTIVASSTWLIRRSASAQASAAVSRTMTWRRMPKRSLRPRAAKAAFAARGRRLSFGIRLHVIVRETAAEAWAEAERLISHVDDATIVRAQATFARMDSVGQRRMLRLHGGRRDKLEISPNLWAGVGLVRGGAGTALVGDPEQVAARMREYMELGINRFILSGYPHLEECYRFAEIVMPL